MRCSLLRASSTKAGQTTGEERRGCYGELALWMLKQTTAWGWRGSADLCRGQSKKEGRFIMAKDVYVQERVRIARRQCGEDLGKNKIFFPSSVG